MLHAVFFVAYALFTSAAPVPATFLQAAAGHDDIKGTASVGRRGIADMQTVQGLTSEESRHAQPAAQALTHAQVRQAPDSVRQTCCLAVAQ